MSRGILYLVWKGDNDPTASLARSIASLKHWHPELEHKIVELPAGSNLLVKSKMFEASPFEETLFLDADTTVMGKLDYGFRQAERFGIACCVNANPWQRRYYKLEACGQQQHADAVEYSSGVVFFHKYRHKVDEVFDLWNRLDGTDTTCSYFESSGGIRRQPFNDQALFTLAMERMGFNPFVLPLNWNLYPKWQKHFWGELKIWHGYDDIPPALLRWNEDQSRSDAVIRCVALP